MADILRYGVQYSNV